MSGLIKNEMIKAYKSGFIKAALCIILVFSIAIPVGKYLIANSESNGIESFGYDELAESETSTVGKAYYKTYGRVENYFKENDISYSNDWRYNEFYSRILSLEMAKSVCELAKGGSQKNEVENYFMYENLNSEISLDEDMFVFVDDNNYRDVFTLKPDELTKKIKEIDSMLEKLKAYILQVTIFDLYESDVAEYTADAELSRDELAKREAELKKNPENARAEYERDSAAAGLKRAEAQLWGANYLKKNKCDYNSWQYDAVNFTLKYAANSYADSVIMKESLFVAGDESKIYKSYDEYVKIMKANEKRCDEAITLVKYSLENNIPIPECSETSARADFFGNAGIMAIIVELLMVAIACTTLYTEYTTGSIRLLLIRPKSRSKILLSKLLTVIIYGAITMAASMLIIFVLDILLHTEKDMSVPYLLMSKSGEVIKIPAIIYTAMSVGARFFSGFVIISAVFMISALFNKGGILALMFGAADVCGTWLVALICSEFAGTLKTVISYTVLPYLDLSRYMGNAVKSFCGDVSVFNSMDITIGFNARVGVILCTAHIALFLIIAFIGFNKKQIKN